MTGRPPGRVRRRLVALLGGSLSGAAIRTGGATLLLSAVTLSSNIVITVLLAGLLGASGYGVYAFALATAMVLGIPAVLGLAPLVVRTVAAAHASGDWGLVRGAVRRATQAVVASSVLVLGLGAVIGPIALRDRPALLGAYSVGLVLVPVLALATVRQAVMQGLGRVVACRVPEAVVQPAVLVALVLAAAAAGRLTGRVAVGAHVAAALVALLVGTVLLARATPAEARRAGPVFADRAWARAVLPLMLINGIGALNQRFDVILLGLLRSPEEAGVFAVADRAASLGAFFVTAAAYPLAPVIARLWANGARDQLQQTVIQASRLVFAGSLVITLPLVVFGGTILSLLGTDFSSGHRALVILCAGQLVNAGTGVVGLVLMMTGHESRVARSVAWGAVAGIALNVALVPPFGVVGAAVGTASGLAVVNLSMLVELRRCTGIWAGALGRVPR